MSNNKDKSFDRITKTIVNKSNYIAKKKIDKAQYDKSYNAVILGVNQNFVDDVPDKDKSELISKHSIPETVDNGKYYTFKINGIYYVKKSNTDFKLYENVVIRIPNGSWDNMFIEVQRDTVNDSTEPSPAPSLDFGQVSFEKNRLYYNGETYYLQFGLNKRIMCVTKGKKYALIKSMDYTGSRIEAATAVMKGLTDDWDAEFDCFAGSSQIRITSILSGYSGAVECDWGDGTVDNNIMHTYSNAGAVTIRVKLLGSISSTITVYASNLRWDNSDNKACFENHIGARMYIGGNITSVNYNTGNAVTHICYGEKVREITGNGVNANYAEGRAEMGIPPFVESIGDYAYQYVSDDYIYIPESCVSIGRSAFLYHRASEIEIEEKGNTLEIKDHAFSYSTESSGFNRVDVIRIPARVVNIDGGTIIEGCNTGAIIFGRGRTEIPNYICMRAGKAEFPFSEISDRPFFIFIPKTVEKIGSFLVESSYTPERKVYVVFEGRSVTINSGNCTILSDKEKLYANADKIIETFIRGR